MSSIKEPIVRCMACDRYVDSKLATKALKVWAFVPPDPPYAPVFLPPGSLCEECMNKIGDGRIDVRELRAKLLAKAS